MTARERVHRFDHHRGKLPLLQTANPLRTSIFLAITFAAFLVVNAFWLYISSGRWVSFQPSAYWRDLFTPLGEAFIFPLGVLSHKWMIAVNSLVLGLVIFVPVIISVLYRSVWGFLAVAIVAVVGHSPVLALTLALGCMFAARTPLRSDVPFVAVLLGLLPPAVYLMLFSFVGTESAALPFEQLLLKAPLLGAIVTAVLSGAAVLALARLTDYRSGVVWPVVAVLLAGPMLVFFLLVGNDEMQYSLLTAGLTPTDTLLEQMPVEEWRARNGFAAASPQDLLEAVQADLENRKRLLTDKCESFLARYKRSNRAAAVLWSRAQAASLQVDAGALKQGRVRYNASYVSAESGAAWARLADSFALEPQAALANWHLAELALREGNVPEALDRLHRGDRKLRKLLDRRRENNPEPMDMNAFGASAMVPRRGYYQGAQAGVQQLLWTLEKVNTNWDMPSVQALRAWLALDPCGPDYVPQLQRLVDLCGKTNLGEELRLALAKATGDIHDRAMMLKEWNGRADSPVCVEASFELGELAMRLPSPRPPDLNWLKPAKDYFQAVLAAGDNPWTALARQRLSVPAKPKEKP